MVLRRGCRYDSSNFANSSCQDTLTLQNTDQVLTTLSSNSWPWGCCVLNVFPHSAGTPGEQLFSLRLFYELFFHPSHISPPRHLSVGKVLTYQRQKAAWPSLDGRVPVKGVAIPSVLSLLLIWDFGGGSTWQLVTLGHYQLWMYTPSSDGKKPWLMERSCVMDLQVPEQWKMPRWPLLGSWHEGLAVSVWQWPEVQEIPQNHAMQKISCERFIEEVVVYAKGHLWVGMEKRIIRLWWCALYMR